MRAMVLDAPGKPLRPAELPVPEPGPGQLLLRVRACGLCRTDLHIVDGELREPKLPLVPGHQIVGTVVEAGAGAAGAAVGDRVGVPWLGWTCGACRYCRSGRENLCDSARFTGYHLDGGLAEYAVADARFCFPVPAGYPDLQAAPLLCAGLIGYRSLRFAGDAERLGIYGFGAAAHIVAQVARWQGRRVFAFARRGDAAAQAFARELGAEWAGASDESPPEPLDAALVFAPAGELVPAALRAVAKGGVVVCGGIHMSDIPSFPYDVLWGERVVRSVANLTRADGEEFLALAPRVPVRTEVRRFALAEVNQALDALRAGAIRGAAVVEMEADPDHGGRPNRVQAVPGGAPPRHAGGAVTAAPGPAGGSGFREAMRLLPNRITALRMLSIPVLWALALLGEAVPVGVGAAVAGLTDVVDGRLARRTRTTSRFGSAFDSVADHLLSASLVAWLVLLRPEFVREQFPVLAAWGALALGVLAYGWARFRRLGGLHLYSAKAAGVLGYVFAVVLLVSGDYHPLFFYAVIAAATVGAVETLLVLATRRELDEHVGSIFFRR